MKSTHPIIILLICRFKQFLNYCFQINSLTAFPSASPRSALCDGNINIIYYSIPLLITSSQFSDGEVSGGQAAFLGSLPPTLAVEASTRLDSTCWLRW